MDMCLSFCAYLEHTMLNVYRSEKYFEENIHFMYSKVFL
jgi:hypothetical protein